MDSICFCFVYNFDNYKDPWPDRRNPTQSKSRSQTQSTVVKNSNKSVLISSNGIYNLIKKIILNVIHKSDVGTACHKSSFLKQSLLLN